MQQADGDGFGRRLTEARGELARIVVVQRLQHLTGDRHPFGDLEAEVTGHERLGLRPEVVVEVRHPHAAQLEHVAESFGRHERSPCTAVLEDCVRRHRRPVHDRADVRTRELAHGLDHGAVVVRWRRQDLRHPHAAVAVEGEHIRERAADVRADSHATATSLSDGSDGARSSTVVRTLSWITRSAALPSRASQASRNAW